jgi:hypothetical protein
MGAPMMSWESRCPGYRANSVEGVTAGIQGPNVSPRPAAFKLLITALVERRHGSGLQCGALDFPRGKFGVLLASS